MSENERELIGMICESEDPAESRVRLSGGAGSPGRGRAGR